ncbi:unnamed protein product [Oppiella nova]|uniref:Complex I-49kD n=1 Tax=Oppiella nova TaxID=334625 RepID=A0A7R9MBW9_9ACAR|nr:unnamed protein product [Oppiella nova]CAG2174470.1 unnamed protein product [Oppiella nova]
MSKILPPLLSSPNCHVIITRCIAAYKHTSGGQSPPLLAINGEHRYHQLRGLAKRWFPDKEYYKELEGETFAYADDSARWVGWESKIQSRRPRERHVRNMVFNFGPQHRALTECYGCGEGRPPYRATEKLMEYKTYTQALPYMDRLDYVSMMCNEQCYSLDIERLLSIQVPKRPNISGVWSLSLSLSLILNNYYLIPDSNVCGDDAYTEPFAAHGYRCHGFGAITPFLWICEEREKLMEFYERVSGARMHASYIRPGGVSQDLPIHIMDDIYRWANQFSERLDEV